MATLHVIAAPWWAYVHPAAPLPAARAVVVGVPAAILLLYWWVTRGRSGR